MKLLNAVDENTKGQAKMDYQDKEVKMKARTDKRAYIENKPKKLQIEVICARFTKLQRDW